MSDTHHNSLPQPVGRQKEVLYLPPTGHTVVLGTAGSGKTLLAIFRSLYLANPKTDHCGRTLLVTFNRCLVAYMKHLSREYQARPVIENYHQFARGYLTSRCRLGANDIVTSEDERLAYVERAMCQMIAAGKRSTILERPPEFLDDEFEWMRAHGIQKKEDYITMIRVGRAQSRIRRADRSLVFDLFRSYQNIREGAGKLYDWSDLATAVLTEFNKDDMVRRYRHIVIDEGQDFSPEMIRSLAAAIPDHGSLTFFGDVAQQIYGRRISWRQAGLNLSQVWLFSENYRNSPQISRLALALAEMPDFTDDRDLVEPNAPTADGPLPICLSMASEAKEIEFVAKKAVARSRTESVAILFKTRALESKIITHLPRNGIRLHRKLQEWHSGPGLYHGTYHAAKGLEFDTVFLPLLSCTHWDQGSQYEYLRESEVRSRYSRLLYVGITRAKSNLILTYSGKITPLLPSNNQLFQS